MSYFPAGTPLPFNSQRPNTARLMRSAARAQRIGAMMARGRTSNKQCQTDRQGINGLSGLSADQMQELSDAPVMVQGDVAKITCSAGSDKEKPICTEPTSAPPWGNALMTRQPCPAPLFGGGFSLGDWICDHPWLTLAIAAGGGILLKSISEK